MRRIRRLIFIIVIALITVPSAARGDLRQFIPRIYSNEAVLALDAAYEENENTSGGTGGLQTKDTFFSERFIFSTTGWVYHPRFIVFRGKLGLGLNQENFMNEKVPGSGGWKNTFVEEYEFRAIVLPEHPYNLEVYTLRENPYIKGKISLGFPTVAYDTGAIFRYKKRPYKFSLGYNVATLESDTSTTRTKTLRTNGLYYKKWGSIAGAYSHENADTESNNGPSIARTSDDYSLENQLVLFKRKVFFTTKLDANLLNQKSFENSLDDTRYSLTEQGSAELPWGFQTNVFYNYFDDTLKATSNGPGVNNTLSSTSNSVGFSILHRLYNSLRTSYNFNYTTNSSDTGDSSVTNQYLTSSYIKNIPLGVLSAGISVGRADVETKGATTVVNEMHSAQIFGEFTLDHTDIDEDTLVIRVKAPDSGVLVDMTKDTDYLVLPIGTTLRIEIIAIPPDAVSKDPFFTYDFQVSYSLISQNARTRTDSFGYNVRLDLFDHFLAAYYGYYHSNQKVLSGSVNGIPLNATSNTVGVIVQRSPFRLLAEYVDYESTVNPSKTFKVEGTYRQHISRTTNIFARAFYNRVRRTATLNSTGNTFTETVLGGDLRLEKRFPKLNLSTSLGASYFQTGEISTTRTYLLNGVLTWRAGRLYVNAGANFGLTETEITTKQQLLHQYYYLSIRRQLL
jgi:hypothetical protein